MPVTTLAHRRHDWLDLLRGELPPLAPHRECDGGPLPVIYAVAVAHGLLVGLVTGGICGAFVVVRYPPLLLLAIPYGAVVGGLFAIAPSVVLGGAITTLAAYTHSPLREVRRFHREVWLVLLVGIGLLDALALLTVSGTPSVPWPVLLAAPTAIVLVLLRRSARKIVVAYAERCGWLRLD